MCTIAKRSKVFWALFGVVYLFCFAFFFKEIEMFLDKEKIIERNLEVSEKLKNILQRN
jgi:hypothetical protein